MSNELVPAGGDNALVPYGEDGAVTTADVGDVSTGRSAPARQGEATASLQQTSTALVEEIGREFGVTSDQVTRALAKFAPKFEQLREHFLAPRDQRDKGACEAALKREWGPDYGRHVDTVRRALDLLGDELGEDAEQDFLCARLPDGTALLNSPQAFLAFFELARHIGADDESDRARCLAELGTAFTLDDKELLKAHVPVQVREARDAATGRAILNTAAVVEWLLAVLKRQPRGAGSSPAPDLRPARLREIEDWMRAAPGSADYRKYGNDPTVQQEYQRLLGAGVTRDQSSTAAGAGARPRVSAEVDAELREIRKLMQTPGSSYYRGPDAERLQRRYRELLDELRDAGV
jgi:hypothetical protein